MRTMTSPAFNIALLLFSANVVKSVEDKNEEELKLKDKRGGHHAEEVRKYSMTSSCRACKFIVNKVKKKLGSDQSKEKIRQLLNNTGNGVKISLIRSGCKKIVRKYQDKVTDALANSGSAAPICDKFRMCK
uniref:Saposin B-type domain-containing protein n=1 Tax=Labrus bergylta TaxID=56723 RepID=A0A3Q3LES1_9LABR